MKLASEINAIINSEYQAIGTCGMSKDVLVKGKLIEVNRADCSAILKDSKGRLHEVNFRTLELI